MSFDISCHLTFHAIIVIIITKVIMSLMLKVVIKDRCLFKKWARWIVIGQYHVKSSFGANKIFGPVNSPYILGPDEYANIGVTNILANNYGLLVMAVCNRTLASTRFHLLAIIFRDVNKSYQREKGRSLVT